MTKKQMVESIVDLFNKHARSKINNAQKEHIVLCACNANPKEVIQREYWRVADLERTQHISFDIAQKCNQAIWNLTCINICPGD